MSEHNPSNNQSHNHSYRRILRTTGLIGGASVIKIGLLAVRNKVLALWLGPGGIGLMGMLNAILTLGSEISSMGVGGGAVRQIAAARGREDEERVGAILATLRRLAILFALLGAAAVWWLREWISLRNFGVPDYAPMIGWLSLGVLAAAGAAALDATLQGCQRIGDLARASVLGALLGTVLSIAFVIFLGDGGIVLFVIIMHVAALAVTGYFVLRLRLKIPRQTVGQTLTTAGPILALGVTLISSALLQNIVQVLLRGKIIRQFGDLGLDANGMFQAAWGISIIYLGFVMEAMTKDFYPRLSTMATDRAATRRLVNEQMHVALLLTGPALAGMMALAPLVVAILYSADFQPAVPLLRWMVLANVLKVFCWPMAFIMLAQNRARLFFLTELLFHGLFLAAGWYGLERFGLTAIGVAFAGTYLIHALVVFGVARMLCGFKLEWANARLAAGILLISGLIFAAAERWPFWGAFGGVLVAGLMTWLALRELARAAGEHPLHWLRRKLRRDDR